ncbi:GNAT family N-acetyltransferase [Gelidibacter salicanalis]|uniref:GNAT family N-acetyltransferase n=1 Tax=Gelidibacter salicanalis TaxID=291193 RepID=A0A934KHW8_9FLAO|nr:GNAT family N-acetyltransferase [Gelidibacter salicanalis]MBJ7879262.1 GNAT family N-acetyltransferase [Gelidibacter salicanalis]
MDIQIRQATVEDLPEITSIFRDTIRNINSKYYSEKQIEVWSSGADDIEDWKERIENLYFIVAEAKNQIVGFSYLNKGYNLEGLYVSKNYLRRTVGSKLLRIMESRVSINGLDVIKSDISINALDFFDSHYYEVDKKLKKNIKGLAFQNYTVSREL